ncbi:8-oxo-dGTP pyrophosphatase MutT (NUDIX family) [Duganella sp. 1224]|uniref:CoA pyrophosphatase n=1 Tax=Duganella sp. 1224 TaxID=2587052 RepID=UPI0015CD4C86|nr:CoA pyrophosphatase [Duganella sp. 1224]NYE62364.1 8-oxo-dGTP pyrophosphatase MutT (NUDIX family) [Duganella sp. 1224]
MAQPPFDPQQLPIDGVAGEPALAPERLAPAWLRRRFATPPAAWTPEGGDAVMPSRAGRPPTPASVLIPLVQRAHGLTVLLTQRTADLTDHPGQISFPGGRAEVYDRDAVDTALRESEEEIGLARRHVEILGSLPRYLTGTAYCVTPVVGLIQPPFEVTADPSEVAAIFEVPLAYLMDGANHRRQSFALAGGRRSFYAMPYEGYYIWGATAGMIRNLFHFLRAD